MITVKAISSSKGASNPVTFKLLKEEMVEVGPMAYRAYRGDIKLAFGYFTPGFTISYSFVDIYGDRRTAAGGLRMNTSDRTEDKWIEIGCMKFSGANYDKLRKWADR